jgi:murein DD-endopeptidase MepM/ murein hydrolase activator NlpD
MIKKSKLILAIIAISICSSRINVLASSQQDIQNQINNNKSKINSIEKEQSNIKSEKTNLEKDLQSIVNEITKRGSELSVVENKLTSLKSEISKTEQIIGDLTLKIEDTKKSISVIQREIAQKEEDQRKRSDLLALRLRALYMNNQTDAILEFLFQSKGIIDLIERFDVIQMVYSYDSEVIDGIKLLKVELEKSRAELEAQKQSIEANKSEVQTELAGLDSIKSDLEKEKMVYNKTLSELQSIEATKETTIAALSEKDKELQSKIGDLTAYNESLEYELKNILSEINQSDKSEDKDTPQSSDFLRPVSGPITSPFGPRVHPIYGTQGYHKGIDYGAPSGTPIKSSKSGTVVLAKYSTSYGNYIIVNHGNGVQTLYAHASSLNCSVGQKVQQGQVIAYVGSTGWSTGAHLHFEIRINEEAVNPQKYIPK